METIFTSFDERVINQDLKLFHQALRGNWLSLDKRAEIQERLFNLAVSQTSIDNSRSFAKLVSLLWKLFQIDMRAEVRAARMKVCQDSPGATPDSGIRTAVAVPIQDADETENRQAGPIVATTDRPKNRSAKSRR